MPIEIAGVITGIEFITKQQTQYEIKARRKYLKKK